MHFKATRMLQAVLSLAVLAAFTSIAWVHDAKVPLGNADFDSCVPKAFQGMTGVAIPSRGIFGHHVDLEVELSDHTIFKGVEVQFKEGNVADIMFAGTGSTEPDDQRKLIEPVLAKMKVRLEERCGEKS
jgi:hypothetical protein